MFLSLNDVNFRPVGRDSTSAKVLSDLTACEDLVEPIGIEPMTS